VALPHRHIRAALFGRESLLNTPLFVGFPGFVSKLWLAHDDDGVYRGVYEWDGPARAEYYARCLWRILELGACPAPSTTSCCPDSVATRSFGNRARC
jgi:hypothetical protein